MIFFKKMTPIFLLVAGMAVGFYVAKYINDDEREDLNEDIISYEIALLEAAKLHMPPCNQMHGANGIFISKEGGLVILWKKIGAGNELEKFVIDKDFNTALDVVSDNCDSS